VKFLWTKFQKLLHQIPERHRPGGKFLVYLFTNGLQAHLSFLLNKRKPDTLEEARDMAIQIERNLISRGISSFTMDAITLMEIVSLEGFDTQEVKKRVSKQNDNVIKEQEPEQETEQDDEVSTIAPPTEEVMQETVSPVQQNKDEVSSDLHGTEEPIRWLLGPHQGQRQDSD
jgi:phage repressor protein C with HTH and peptisase S24 domain